MKWSWRNAWRCLAVLGVLTMPALAAEPATATRIPVAASTSEERMRRDVAFLASEQCEGRGVSTKGIHLAADYIAQEFRKAGLKPAGPGGSFFQPFSMAGNAELQSPNSFVLRGPQGQVIDLPLDSQFRPVGLSGAGKVTGGLVFAGYGATATDIGYDDFKGVDMKGKILFILRKTPRTDNSHAPFVKDRREQHETLNAKLVNAELHNAAAVVFVNDQDTAKEGDRLMEFTYTSRGGTSAKMPVAHVRRAVLDALLRSATGSGLVDLEEDIDRDLKPRSLALAGWSGTLEVSVRRQMIPAKNVVGVLEGSGSLANQTVVIGAHYDHLGYGGAGSLARNLKVPTIHHGADDNASGTTVLLELARRFGQERNRTGRRLVFLAFSGEESGLIGSDYYCKNPLFPLADTVAMVNLDMVGRLRPEPEKPNGPDRLIVYGTGTAKTFDALIDSLNARHQFSLKKVATGNGPSDQMSFYNRQVPVFFFFTGDHPDYHRPSDTAEKINVAGMRRIADLVYDLVAQLSTVPERPEYVKVSGGTGMGPRARGPRLGIMPDYADDKEGVLLSGVSDDGPAARAGLKAGDRIVEIGGKPVKSIESYMVLMAGQKLGDTVSIGIVRQGKPMKVDVLLK